MNVSLTPQLERLIHRKVKTGLYQTASEVVREGLRLLQQRDEFERQRLRQAIQAGLDSGFDEYDEQGLRALAEEIKAEGRARKAAHQKSD